MVTAKHAIKYPSRVGATIGVLFSVFWMLFWMFTLLGDIRAVSVKVLLLLSAVAILANFVLWIIALVRTSKLGTDLQFDRDQLVIYDRTVRPEDIKTIMIKGYFNPIVGLLPHGKRVVPVAMTFRFTSNEDRGFADLKDWADRNQVRVVHRSFQRWI
ncbi:hypothetical protein [Paenibacillus methanolicus]|uniref:PH (Pleckstrin Homology) domain-containing protein n=1 Tax=Paenibacillus methanolicus TaxID=582686 RepID=A0A5S5C455_9BACL|nr:hypothetical protein [Paenibacillus methanolicus]TYP73206.1 hypothetical protein BCM02_107190 [Paenibacillus methanolicus]